jgi:hypothetical protein
MWELSHYTKQHPTASTRNSLNNVNKLGCTCAEAFSQSDPNTPGFNSQENHPTKILV